MASRKTTQVLSLKQFMLRGEVLRLYRAMLKTTRGIPDKQQRGEMRFRIRDHFKGNKSSEEEDAIRMMITQGRISLKELERTIPTTDKT